MKRTQLLVLSVLALGLQGIAQAGSFPADADASYNLPARGSYSEQQSGGSSAGTQSAFPADAEASYNLIARGSYAEKHASDVVSARAQASVAFNSVNIDD
jgi:hypothetical protein